MWVASIEKEGSTFSFTLPVEQGKPDFGEAGESQRRTLATVGQ